MSPEQVAAASLSLYDASSADETRRREVETWVARGLSVKLPEAVLLASKLGVIRIREGRFDEAGDYYGSWLAPLTMSTRSTAWPGCWRCGIGARPRRPSD